MGHPLGQLCFPCHGGDQRRPAFHQRRFDHRAAKDLGVKTSLGAAQSGHAYDLVLQPVVLRSDRLRLLF
jgi:hypothetical protein